MKTKESSIWVANNMSEPLTKGYYTCLVEIDEFGTLSDIQECYYDGLYWSNYESGAQFTRYWLATPNEYSMITKRLNEELENHNRYDS